jgi:hypothetical protein
MFRKISNSIKLGEVNCEKDFTDEYVPHISALDKKYISTWFGSEFSQQQLAMMNIPKSPGFAEAYLWFLLFLSIPNFNSTSILLTRTLSFSIG